jgi:hypothetical protein
MRIWFDTMAIFDTERHHVPLGGRRGDGLERWRLARSEQHGSLLDPGRPRTAERIDVAQVECLGLCI